MIKSFKIFEKSYSLKHTLDLFEFLKNKQYDKAKEIIEEYPQIIDTKNDDSETPLLYSVWNRSDIDFIKYLIEKIDNIYTSEILVAKSVIKIIGLLNIFCQNNLSLGKDLIINYSNKSLGIKNAKEIIESLVTKKIIIYREYNKRYILFEGTDLDIQTSLLEAGQKTSQITDISTLVNKYYQLPPIIAKEETYKKGTPRLFEYRITSQPIDESPIDEIDGFINLIFNDKLFCPIWGVN